MKNFHQNQKDKNCEIVKNNRKFSIHIVCISLEKKIDTEVLCKHGLCVHCLDISCQHNAIASNAKNFSYEEHSHAMQCNHSLQGNFSRGLLFMSIFICYQKNTFFVYSGMKFCSWVLTNFHSKFSVLIYKCHCL